ncbi:SDR family NAD(P)-dependent oxidoreductase [Glaciecola siphonariae]|uniref:SDR family NAD(P)-dependent oxidoreductase n=1 Tax=Glaciecola siphonariae TaxID=521012 RepID=A0ABV9LZ54_9ALTE
MVQKVWFITGASRGLGLDMARAALRHGDKVVATARNAKGLVERFGEHKDLVALDMDVTNQQGITNAVTEAVKHFERIDVLVNNAGYGQMGRFETVSSRAIERQFAVNVFGVMDVTREVLPLMRKQKSGHIFNVSSIGGARGYAGSSVYCASKFTLEGWSEGLADELESFGIKVTIVEPGFFRTDFLDASSVSYGDIDIPVYADSNAEHKSMFDEISHAQAGDPAKLGDALVTLTREENPPMRFAAGSDALEFIGSDFARRLLELAQWSKLTCSTDISQ